MLRKKPRDEEIFGGLDLVSMLEPGEQVLGLMGALDAMFSIESPGAQHLQILVTYGSDQDGALWEAMRLATIGRYRVCWIPVALDQARHGREVAAAIEGGPAALQCFLRGEDAVDEPSDKAVTFSRWQAEFFKRQVEIELKTDSGEMMGFPVVVVRDDRRSRYARVSPAGDLGKRALANSR